MTVSETSMAYVSCNLCGFDETRLVAEQSGYRMVECGRCGLVYVNPRPAPAALVRLYEGYHQRGDKDDHTWSKLMGPNFLEVADLLNNRYPEKGRLLDIGCGYGHFIEMMRNRGWDVSGIEPSEKTSTYAQSKGLDVRRTVMEDMSFPHDSFEAITAFYVLEHLFDPLAALVKIRKALKPGGMMVLRVPHTTPVVKILGRLCVRNNLYDMPFHLYDFSPVTIRLLLEKTGFENIRVTPGYHTVPPNPAERCMSLCAGIFARLLFKLSGGSLLMPGVSKTIIAGKPILGCKAGHA